jgi:multidrug transporter EmrE-like cation transporter
MTKEWAILETLLSVAVGAFGPIFLKLGTKSISFRVPSTFMNRWLVLGVISYATATAIYVPALRGAELSLIYPLISLNFAIVAILSMRFLNEPMNGFKWFGIALIITGAAVVGAS